MFGNHLRLNINSARQLFPLHLAGVLVGARVPQGHGAPLKFSGRGNSNAFFDAFVHTDDRLAI